jgi:hypothetical protein
MDLLRYALKLDAGVSGVAAVALMAGSRVLDDPLGIPAAALFVTGLVLVAWTVGLWAWASRPEVSRRAAWTVVALNAVWVAGSVVLALDWSALTAVGTAVVLAQAVGVLVLANLEYVGLRRA